MVPGIILSLDGVMETFLGLGLVGLGLLVGGIGLSCYWRWPTVWGVGTALVLVLSAPFLSIDYVIGVGVLTVVMTGVAVAVAEWWEPDWFWRWVCLLLGGGLALYGGSILPR